ncbi:MAG: 4-(cytidine 5'-diphospho)-2-C-methyl-D-erythritol kinase [Fibrobacterales bacterium]|nr:4-(cytidine 5'-diphospho)-2-C-methyl-D-erythritol kinase [Fibrobacterales bacterium]
MADFENAYAKVNLFLEIVRKREDGYHDIGTLFQTIGLCDRLEGESREDGEIVFECDRPATERPEQDLVHKAAVALRERAGNRRLGATLRLEKRLPSGAGLGGGSADAAAALRLLNRVWNLGLPASELEKVGASLGADVPFLVRGGTALAEGIGDRLEAAPPPPECALLVVTPEASVPTAKAYAGVRPAGAQRWEDFKALWRKGNLSPRMVGHLLHNGFEPGVFGQWPEIAECAAELRETGALGVLLSGSGASVFALYPTEDEARKALSGLASPRRFEGVTRFVSARTL